MADSQQIDTKNRIVAAARTVFSANGLADARVRDICRLAEANVASINYYFGSKEELYVTILHEHMAKKENEYPLVSGSGGELTNDMRLFQFIRSFLGRLLDEDEESERLGWLILREIFCPASARFATLVHDNVLPAYSLLLRILERLLPQAEMRTLRQCALSIFGQCLLPRVGQKVFSLLSPELAFSADTLDATATFIQDFSLGGIERLNAK